MKNLMKKKKKKHNMYFQSSSTSQNLLLCKPSIVKWRPFENLLKFEKLLFWRLTFAKWNKYYFVVFGYFDFAFFNMTVVKNLMKKYPFMKNFQNAYSGLVLHNFFCSETLFHIFRKQIISDSHDCVGISILERCQCWKYIIFRIETIFNLIHF